MRQSWGWAGSVKEFLSISYEHWSASLAQHQIGLLGLSPGASQKLAWEEEHGVMTSTLRSLAEAAPEVLDWGIAFEYELPLEGGRRPDVVVLAGGSVLVLEFKSSPFPEAPQIDQVEAYARDLADYHEGTHGRPAIPILVLPRAVDFAVSQGDFVATSPENLAQYLYASATEGSIQLEMWLNAPYAPLPTLVEAARRIFQHQPLPHVKRALSAGIPEAIEALAGIVEKAASERRRVMVFVTGVPGAGKTLVGLRFVYERAGSDGTATFLSGNGPLVRVLQDALKSRVFVRDLHAYINTYALSEKIPREKVIVFDEAQRAWDAAYMLRKKSIAQSEPQLLVEVGRKIVGWSALVGLVGEGQEIHSGEEGGIKQWGEAVAGDSAWTVHCPPKLEMQFGSSPVVTHSELDLDISLRSRRAESIHEWVQLVLDGRLGKAARLGLKIQEQKYPLYVTRDLDEAKTYAFHRYEGEGSEKRFGFLASSHAKNMDSLGFDISFLATRKMKIEKWFNAPQADPLSCCALGQPATEFQCQGLELDLPLLLWGDDLRWSGDGWKANPIRRQHALQDPGQILRNTYRVLLTRGRDGLVVIISPDAEFDLTEHALLAAGFKPLPEPLTQVA
jgi:DUF2075 family protein